MHEAAVMQGVVRTVLECLQQTGASRVTHVQMVIGVSGHFTAEAAHQYFEVLVKGTSAEGASLSIQWVPAKFQCFACLHQFERCEPTVQVSCPRCGESALEVGHQDVCSVSAIDVTSEQERGGLHIPRARPWKSQRPTFISFSTQILPFVEIVAVWYKRMLVSLQRRMYWPDCEE